MNKKLLNSVIMSAMLAGTTAIAQENIKPPGEPYILNHVEDLEGAVIAPHVVAITWTDSSVGEDCYEVDILRVLRNKGEYYERITLPANSRYLIYTPREPGQYILRVRPVRGSDATAFSNAVLVKIKPGGILP